MSDHRIKVVHVITKLDVGGAQETALSIVTSLGRTDFDACLICGPETGTTGSLHDEARRSGVNLQVLPSLVRRLSPLRDVRATFQLWGLFRRERPDVVHTHSSKAGVVGRLAARLAGVPVVVHSVHGWSFRPYMPAWQHGAAVFVERLMARMCDHLIVVAHRDREEGLARGVGTRSQYRVIRSGIRCEQFASARTGGLSVRRTMGVPPGAPLIGTVARLAPPKDPETFLRAAASILSRRPDAYFVVVGDGPQRRQAEGLAADLQLGNRILFTGVRRNVAEMLGALDVFVLASNSEGLPRVVTEAMAAGVAVVASDVGGVAEVVHDGITGRLVPPGEVGAMADAVLGLLGDPPASKRIAEGGRALAGDFDVAVMHRAFHEVYRSASSGRWQPTSPPLVSAGDRAH